MVSAACPNCKIVLVEANSATFSNLAAAENTAARLAPHAISNSYGTTSDVSGAVYPARDNVKAGETWEGTFRIGSE